MVFFFLILMVGFALAVDYLKTRSEKKFESQLINRRANFPRI